MLSVITSRQLDDLRVAEFGLEVVLSVITSRHSQA